MRWKLSGLERWKSTTRTRYHVYSILRSTSSVVKLETTQYSCLCRSKWPILWCFVSLNEGEIQSQNDVTRRTVRVTTEQVTGARLRHDETNLERIVCTIFTLFSWNVSPRCNMNISIIRKLRQRSKFTWKMKHHASFSMVVVFDELKVDISNESPSLKRYNFVLYFWTHSLEASLLPGRHGHKRKQRRKWWPWLRMICRRIHVKSVP